MTDLFPDAEIPLEAQIECVERDLRMRQRVYERQVARGNMSQKQADREITLMTAVLMTLKSLQDKER